METSRLCDELNDTTGLGDLLLSQTADPAGADDEGDLGEAALAENLGVAEGEQVDDGDGVLLLALEVGLTGLLRNQAPELVELFDEMLEACSIDLSKGGRLKYVR